MAYKNQHLYNLLKQAFGRIGIASLGEQAVYKVPPPASILNRTRGNTGIRWAYDVKGGERYKVRCPFCHKDEKCWVSYVCNTKMQTGDGEVWFGKAWVTCYRCEFERDRTKRDEFWRKLNTGGYQTLVEDTPEEVKVLNAIEESGFPKSIPVTQSPEGSEYLKSRGFVPEILYRDYRVMYSSDPQFFKAPHIVVPIYQNYEAVTWQARYIGEDFELNGSTKYYFPPGSNKSNLLFNMDSARMHGDVVITEGVFDAMRVGVNGVCIFGKKASLRQQKLLRNFWNTGRAYMMLDRDAHKESTSMVQEWNIKGYFEKGAINIVLGDKDPAELTKEEIWYLIHSAHPQA